MPDIQCRTHSRFRHSGLGNLQLTKVVGECELSDMLSLRYHRFSGAPYEVMDNPNGRQPIPVDFIPWVTGKFPMPPLKRGWKLTFNKPSFIRLFWHSRGTKHLEAL